MTKKPVNIGPDNYDAVKAYAEANDMTLSAAADFVMGRGLMGLPAKLPAGEPASTGEPSGEPQREAQYSANLSRF